MPALPASNNPNNQSTGGATPAETARDLNRAKQNDFLKQLQSTADKDEDQKKLRQMEDRRQQLVQALKDRDNPNIDQKRRLDLLKELDRLSEELKQDKPKTSVEEFGPETEIPAEGTAESTEEKPPKPEMGKVPMEEEKQEETLAPMEKQDVGEPVKEKPSAQGGGEMPEEKGYFGRTKPATEEGEAAEAEKKKKPTAPGEKPRGEGEAAAGKAAVPTEAEQAAGIKGAQMAQINKGLTGGAEGAMAEKAAEVSEAAGQAMALYKKYKWIVWIGGLVIANIWWIIIGAIIIVLIVIVALITYYMVNNGVDWYTAIKCGTDYVLGGDGISCLLKQAIENAPEALEEAAGNQ